MVIAVLKFMVNFFYIEAGQSMIFFVKKYFSSLAVGIASVLAFVFLFTFPGSVASAELRLGVTGHPFVQEGYRDIPVEVQLDTVRDLGFTWYRTDWYGWAVDNKKIPEVKAFIHMAEAKGINILPVIIPPVDLNRDNPSAIYEKSYKFAQALATAYGESIRVWELGNELDNFAIVRQGERTVDGELWKHGVPDGSRPGFYEKARYQKALALLRGLADGIRAVDSKALTVVNATYLHYGFIERLLRDGLSFNIIGWHWYSDMGDITGYAGDTHLLKQLSSYGRPIWITEFNRRSGSMGTNGENEQAAYLRRELDKIITAAGRYGVETLFIYELFDEPYFGSNNPESHYGLVRVEKKGRNWTVGNEKQSYHVVKKFISENK